MGKTFQAAQLEFCRNDLWSKISLVLVVQLETFSPWIHYCHSEQHWTVWVRILTGKETSSSNWKLNFWQKTFQNLFTINLPLKMHTAVKGIPTSPVFFSLFSSTVMPVWNFANSSLIGQWINAHIHWFLITFLWTWFFFNFQKERFLPVVLWNRHRAIFSASV